MYSFAAFVTQMTLGVAGYLGTAILHDANPLLATLFLPDRVFHRQILEPSLWFTVILPLTLAAGAVLDAAFKHMSILEITTTQEEYTWLTRFGTGTILTGVCLIMWRLALISLGGAGSWSSLANAVWSWSTLIGLICIVIVIEIILEGRRLKMRCQHCHYENLVGRIKSLQCMVCGQPLREWAVTYYSGDEK
jgi:hypothetical protein